MLVSKRFEISLKTSLLGTDGVLQVLLFVLQVIHLLLHHQEVSLQALQIEIAPDR